MLNATLTWSADEMAASFRDVPPTPAALARFIADPRCEVRFDTSFDTVIAACATSDRPGQSGTWIVPSVP